MLVSGICSLLSGWLPGAYTGPAHNGSFRTIGSSKPCSSFNSSSLNPVPTRPAYTNVPFTQSASWSAPKCERLPLGLVKPTMTKSPLRSALILSQSPDRPPLYREVDFLATIPSRPIAVTCSRNASPSVSM